MNLIKSLRRFLTDDHGVGSIWMLCLLPLFLVLAGFGMDGTAAFRTRDMLQSTADASALAGALQLPTSGNAAPDPTKETNAATSARDYSQKNMSVAGFGNVLSLNATTNGDIQFGNWNGTTFTSPTPTGTTENAIMVTVRTAAANSNAYPTSFLALIGKSSWDIAATAVAMNGKPIPLCILTFVDFTSHGGPNTNLAGCSIASNNTMTCTGSNLGATFGFAVGTDSGCGKTPLSGQATVTDTYASLQSSIPTNTCASYPGVSWSGTVTLAAAPPVICGNLTLTGNVTINTPAGGSVLTIENGQLNTGTNNPCKVSSNYTFSTSSGSSLTVIFSGTTASAATHGVTGCGSINFAGSASGTWKEIAIYQDRTLTSNVDLTESGSGAPAWNISGVIYMPNSTLTISGAINNSANGTACFELVAKRVLINGTGDILAQGACDNAPTELAPISLLVR